MTAFLTVTKMFSVSIRKAWTHIKHFDPASFHPGTSLPCHAGIIPDGTCRWAPDASGVSLADVYMQAAGLLQQIVICLLEEGVA